MNRNIACKGNIPFSTFAQADDFPQLNEKNPDLVCLIFIEGCPSLMKINVGLYIKKLFWQLSWDEDYKEKIIFNIILKLQLIFANSKRFFISNVLMRNSPRIVQIWDTSKKHSRADICFIDNKTLIFKNSLFSGSEQNAYCSETYSDHCQISKMECFEAVVDGFELLPIFAKRSILNIFIRDLDTVLLLTLIPPWGRN